MDLKNFKAKGSIGIGAVYSMLQDNPDKDFPIVFVRSSTGDGGVKGSLCVRTVRYGAAPYQQSGISRGLSTGSNSSNRKKSKHDLAGTIPVHYPGTTEYRSPLVSHVLIFDGYLVNL